MRNVKDVLIKDVKGKENLFQVSIGDENKEKIYQFILRNSKRQQGMYPNQITKAIGLTRPAIHKHLRALLNEGKIYKKKGQYFPEDWNLNAAFSFAKFLRDSTVRFIDPYPVTHERKSYDKPCVPVDELHYRTTGISVSGKYCETNFTEDDLEEEHIFEFINRIGAFITYVFIESMRPRERDCITNETRVEMSKSIIFDSISIIDLFYRFCRFLNDIKIVRKKITPPPPRKNKDEIDTVELDKSSFDKISRAFGNIYPGIYDGLEKFWLSSKQSWGNIGKSIARNQYCDHNWIEVYTYKSNRNSFFCGKCNTFADSQIKSRITKKKKRVKRKKIRKKV